jgi:hypothetical protein
MADLKQTSTFVLRITHSLRARLRAASQTSGVSQQAIVRASLASYLEAHHPYSLASLASQPEVGGLVSTLCPSVQAPAVEAQDQPSTIPVVECEPPRHGGGPRPTAKPSRRKRRS